MKNKNFKSFKNANDILNAFIDDYFGIYVSMPTTEVAFISFLPEDKLADIFPAACAPRFNEIARKYTEFISSALENHDLLSDIPDNIPVAEQEQIIKLRFEAFFKLYLAEFGETVQVGLKKYLGLRQAYDPVEKGKVLNVKVYMKVAQAKKLTPCELLPTQVKSLCNQWKFKNSIVRQIFDAFDGSFDRANEYLEFMESEDISDPEHAWDKYWFQTCEFWEDKIQNNPFERRSR